MFRKFYINFYFTRSKKVLANKFFHQMRCGHLRKYQETSECFIIFWKAMEKICLTFLLTSLLLFSFKIRIPVYEWKSHGRLFVSSRIKLETRVFWKCVFWLQTNFKRDYQMMFFIGNKSILTDSIILRKNRLEIFSKMFAISFLHRSFHFHFLAT